jgi:hypothetical protein
MKKTETRREDEDWAWLRALAHIREGTPAQTGAELAADDADTVPVPALALQLARPEPWPARLAQPARPARLVPCPCEPCVEGRDSKRTADRTLLVLVGLWLVLVSSVGRCEPTKAQADTASELGPDIHAIAVELREIRRVLERGCK